MQAPSKPGPILWPLATGAGQVDTGIGCIGAGLYSRRLYSLVLWTACHFKRGTGFIGIDSPVVLVVQMILADQVPIAGFSARIMPWASRQVFVASGS